METKEVNSSHVKAIGYDADTQSLHVEYIRGRPVVYQGVSEDIARQVLNAGSVGTALHLLVRGLFPHSYKD